MCVKSLLYTFVYRMSAGSTVHYQRDCLTCTKASALRKNEQGKAKGMYQHLIVCSCCIGLYNTWRDLSSLHEDLDCVYLETSVSPGNSSQDSRKDEFYRQTVRDTCLFLVWQCYKGPENMRRYNVGTISRHFLSNRCGSFFSLTGDGGNQRAHCNVWGAVCPQEFYVLKVWSSVCQCLCNRIFKKGNKAFMESDWVIRVPPSWILECCVSQMASV